MFKKIINKLTDLDRFLKQIITILADSALVILSIVASFSMRLGYWYWPSGEIFLVIIIAPIIAIPIFISFRLYQSVVRFIGVKTIFSIGQAVTLYAVIWGLLGYMIAIEGIPRGVILINWMLALILIGSSRIIARWLLKDDGHVNGRKKSNVIIYGAGKAGRELSHGLELSDEYLHVAYIDDDRSKEKTYVNSIQVFSYEKIQWLISKYDVVEIFLAIPSLSRKKRNEYINKLNFLSVHVKSLPSVSELTKGKVKIEDLLEINLGELLGRKSAMPNKMLLKTNITDKIVLVTGAGGSIGTELCRQILLLKPKVIIIFDMSESSLYQIEQELLQLVSSSKLITILGSIRDKNKFDKILSKLEVQTIYHTAAYKHVPLVEFNQSEGVLNNIIGTMIIAESAIMHNVENFVLISSDKAVRPTNTMGATKRVAELILQALSKKTHNTCFSMVRFGNVLDSSGSVIPTFKKQIKKGGPITVTHKDIVRYFMTIPEAVELVIQAGAMSKGGEVFVLDMGKPIKIYDLAVKMIQLSGLTLMDKSNPDGDIEIQYSGLRPGEKLYEELLVGSNVSSTENQLIMSAKEDMIDWDILQAILFQIQDAALNLNQIEVRDLLIQLVPEFKPRSKNIDILSDE